MPKKPTLEKVKRDLNGFDESLILYVYHKMNNRDEEAQTYLDEYTYTLNDFQSKLNQAIQNTLTGNSEQTKGYEEEKEM